MRRPLVSYPEWRRAGAVTLLAGVGFYLALGPREAGVFLLLAGALGLYDVWTFMRIR